jgi:hypothetical protein
MRENSPIWALTGLTVLWLAALVGAVATAESAWALVWYPPPPPSSGLALAISELFTDALPLFGAIWCIVIGGPLLVFTWLVVPVADRRTLPIVAASWAIACIAAFAGLLPARGTPFALVASLPAALTAEGFRIVFTATLRRTRLGSPTSASGV